MGRLCIVKPLLELKQVSLAYHSPQGELAVISNLSFSVREGEFLAIVGPSGCGKSTILNLISGLLQPEQGEICIQRRPGSGSVMHIGYMLQKDHLFEWRTIYRNVMLGLEIQHQKTEEKKKQVQKMLETYGLHKFENAHPSQLSGGMRQRAALIRTLALEPDILLLDEPFSALDYQTRLNVSDDIGRIIRHEGKTAILVTHDISEAISMADRVMVLTSRPAHLKREVEIVLENPDRTPIASRNDPRFKYYFNLIWKELNDHDRDVPGAESVFEKTQS